MYNKKEKLVHRTCRSTEMVNSERKHEEEEFITYPGSFLTEPGSLQQRKKGVEELRTLCLN